MKVPPFFAFFQRGARPHPASRGHTGGRRRRTLLQLSALENRQLLSGLAVGGGTGLLGQYYNDRELTGPALNRVDRSVDFDWSASPPDRAIRAHEFSVRWTGQVRPRYSEAYTFVTVSDDGVRLWVNHRLLIDHWADHAPTRDLGTITLAAGQKYDLRMEYYENDRGRAVAKLLWRSASQGEEVIPQSRLYPTHLASLCGSVYADANDDGSRGAGEAGIGGVRLTLSGATDLGQSVSLTTATASDGSYCFRGLRPGTYTVTEAGPAGYLPGRVRVGSAGGARGGQATVSGITLASGDRGTGYDFGELAPASLSGVVYVDANDDGSKQPGEAPVPGVGVTLTGTTDLGRAVALTATTAADGSYHFTHLRPGSYAITAATPAGYLPGRGAGGPSGGGATFPGIHLDAGVAGAGFDYGLIRPASLSGSVFVDANANGIRDDGEGGIAGVVVTLSGTTDLGQVIAVTTATADGGSYRFSGLRPGTYTLTAARPAGYSPGAAPPGHPLLIALGPGTANGHHDFAELPPPPPMSPPPSTAPGPVNPKGAVRPPSPTPPPDSAWLPAARDADPAPARQPDGDRSEQGKVGSAGVSAEAPTPLPAAPGGTGGVLFSGAPGSPPGTDAVRNPSSVPRTATAASPAAPPAVTPAPPWQDEDPATGEEPAVNDRCFLLLGSESFERDELSDDLPATPSPPVRPLSSTRADPDPLGKRLLVSSLWLLSTLAAGLPGPQDRAVSTPAGGRS